MKSNQLEYNSAALDIWLRAKPAARHLTKRLPLLRPDLPPPGTVRHVACVGLNGAYNEKFFERHFEKATGTPWSACSSLQYSRPSAIIDSRRYQKRLKDALAFEEFARSNSGYGTYFTPMDRFIEQCGFQEILHLDLFLVRESDSRELHRAMQDRAAADFLASQLELFVETLRSYGVQLVIVMDAKASNALIAYLELEPDDERRFYRSRDFEGLFVLSNQLGAGRMSTFGCDRLVTDARAAAKLLGIPVQPRPPYSRPLAYPLLAGAGTGPHRNEPTDKGAVGRGDG